MVEEFVAPYHEEVNRQRRDATAARAGKERELAEVTRKLDKLIEALIEGYRTAGLQVEIVGEIVRMVELGLNAKQAALGEEAACSVKVVAGAHNQRFLRLAESEIRVLGRE